MSICEVCSPQWKWVTKLEEERMLGSMTISVLLYCCPLMSFSPSGFAVCLSDSLEGMERQQHLANPCRRNTSSSFEVHEWNLLSSLFFCLTPTLIRVVLGRFCISGLWSHIGSWKTLLYGFAFLLKSGTSEVWKEGSARSGSPAPCHMEMLLFRVSLVQNLEELPLPLRRGALQKNGAGLKSCLKYMYSMVHLDSMTAVCPISAPVYFSTVQKSLFSIQELLLQVLWSSKAGPFVMKRSQKPSHS